MSTVASTWAWATRGLPAPVKFTLVAMADNADDDGVCWPGSKFLAAKCESTRATVWRHLRMLESSGLISREPRYNGAERTTNMYQLHLSKSLEGSTGDTGLQQESPRVGPLVIQGLQQESPRVGPLVIQGLQQESPSITTREPSKESSGEPSYVSTIPDWWQTLTSIKEFHFSLNHCQKWLDENNIHVGHANATAYALRGKWPGKYKEPWATFQSWVLRPRLSGAVTNSRATPPKIDEADKWAAEIAQREIDAKRDRSKT